MSARRPRPAARRRWLIRWPKPGTWSSARFASSLRARCFHEPDPRLEPVLVQPDLGASAGAFRIVFGLVVLANLALLSFDIDYWYTDIGMLQGDEARAVAGELRVSPLHWVQDPTSVRLVFAATAVSSGCS